MDAEEEEETREAPAFWLKATKKHNRFISITARFV
jgi:hypothetical protein